MPKFRRKPFVVEAYKIEGRDSWVVTNLDGSETVLPGERFHQLYERVSDLHRVETVTERDLIEGGRDAA